MTFKPRVLTLTQFSLHLFSRCSMSIDNLHSFIMSWHRKHIFKHRKLTLFEITQLKIFPSQRLCQCHDQTLTQFTKEVVNEVQTQKIDSFWYWGSSCNASVYSANFSVTLAILRGPFYFKTPPITQSKTILKKSHLSVHVPYGSL